MRTPGRTAMAGSVCLSDVVLSAYHLGALTGDAWNAAAAHLRACPNCLARLDRLPAIDPILAALRRSPDEPKPSDAAYRRAVARATEEHPSAILHVGPGSTLREYRLLKPLGEGGMGVVFKALHTRLDRVVALKVLRRGRRDSASLARFDREIRAAGRFRHEHIVQATDAGEVNGMPFLVMEFVEGRDLSRLVRERGKLRPVDACEIVRQAALGLAHAHEAGMVHRDVKPSNLMLTPTGSVKVLDLGLALLRGGDDLPPLSDSGDPSTWDNDATLTGSQQALGTRHYMAPEQWKSPHAVDARVDVFGLGCTLVFLLSGRAPRLEDKGEIPGAPLNVLRRMIAADPAERFLSGAEVAAALKPFARGSDLPALASNRPPRFRRRLSRWLGFGALAVLAVCGGWIWNRTRSERWQLPLTVDRAQALQRHWVDKTKKPTVVENSIGMPLVLVPPGELPLHSGGVFVVEHPYRLGACEVTVGQYRAFINRTKYQTMAELGHGGMTMHSGTPTPQSGTSWEKPGSPSSEDHPVTQVAYPDAQAFCAWLSRIEGLTYRLPTVNEWRWACRAGSNGKYSFGDNADELPQYAWTHENAPEGPKPVGKLKPNAWGLYDMLGNVREWNSDTGGPPGRSFRMASGGSVNSNAPQHVVDAKGGFEDWVASSGLGFRVLRVEP